MAAKVYKIVEGGMHDRFHQSKAKIQFLGGGYGNGKTAAVCVRGLVLAEAYPGSNGLIARSTYPKLNDTIRREFFKWCPPSWIKRRPTQDDNTCYLKNGTTINFRYVAQRGKGEEESKSNLLSATYDWIIVDQIEDPEFTHKDFMDLVGRLRGNTDYMGDDPSMPRNGPRWMMLTSNPTRNWVYREIIRPLHQWQKGIYDPKLLCEVDDDGKALLKDGKPTPIIELFEGSTYENRANVGEDYIKTMLSTYTDSLRDRFIFGKWGALSGLVYPTFDEVTHVIDEVTLAEYLQELRKAGYTPTMLEGYDHGLIRPSCYGLAFVDDDGNVFLLDGFYGNETTIESISMHIRRIRGEHGFLDDESNGIWSDPQLFRRTSGQSNKVGTTVAELFKNDCDITLLRGNRDINAGIAKVSQYLAPMPMHEHPLRGIRPSPHLYVSSKCQWFINEITEYYWKKDTSGDATDTPTDKNDHAMDMVKYLLTSRPRLAKFTGRHDQPPPWLSWHEVNRQERTTLPRHR